MANTVYGIALNTSLFMCGLALLTYEKSSLTNLPSERTLFSGIIADYPEEKENSYLITVKLEGYGKNGKILPVKGSIILYNEKDTILQSFLPGDKVVFRCTPLPIVSRMNPCEFDYRLYMENQGIKYYGFTRCSDILKHTEPVHRKIIYRALVIRERIISMFRERGIKGDRLALVAAITLGQKRLLDPDQKINFIKAGVMHIMAVSGLHAIILSLFVFNLLFFLKRKFNILRIVITILILWSFAFITGLTPSVMRATIMYSFLQAGKMMKRPANNINSVLASAFVLILIHPAVIFDAGFQLSYSAVIYIICFYQSFYAIWTPVNWLADKIWQSAVVTIVAQAGTLPLTIALFNRFPTYFILANITIVPVSNLLIVTGCMIPLLYHVKLISTILAIILNYLTGLTESMTALAAGLPLSSIENIGMTQSECILLAITIFFFCYWLKNRKTASLVIPLSCMILFLITGTIKDIGLTRSKELIVYNISGRTTVGIRTGRTLDLFSDSSAISPEVSRHCSALGLKVRNRIVNKGHTCLKTGNTTILIAGKIENKSVNDTKPDYVVLTGKKPFIGKNLESPKRITCIIVSSEAPPGIKFKADDIKGAADSVHYVRKYGAFIKRL